MDTLTNPALLRLLQLASPALPVGAYSYSEGLETLVHTGIVQTVDDLEHWIIQELNYGAARLEAAMLVRSHRATIAQNFDQLLYWNDWFTAARETEELRSQSLQMGGSLIRLFRSLHPDPIPNFEDGCNFAIAFGLVAALWKIDESAALIAYLHSWTTNLVSAGVKLIPLGQTAGQQLLLKLGEVIGENAIADLEDSELESCGWGLSIASMKHETLYSRLFRS
ncbi:urease accessory protein UreF [Leptolyngbya sp. NIES-2104]|uniref:urease accessory protein UreF n=1 Tax=Leptolyngbya sp. NIES-2104 TaxID=1552121 RepID=UPI0006EC60FF|nr:urease accessory protein UreF [Leptolyngbya sp. NIES-2104]GAP94406.1 urease accessory protein UreF [Leptolyngbya sp. NIES-2104]